MESRIPVTSLFDRARRMFGLTARPISRLPGSEGVVDAASLPSAAAQETTHASARRRPIEWPFVERWVWTVILVGTFALMATNLRDFYLTPPFSNLFIDAHIYFRATEAWVQGGNPWLPMWQGIPFAAPPPALLLNLPLIPFGEQVAVTFWVVANSLSLLYIFRRLHLPPYWFLFYPVFEGFLGATPDIALAALVMLGGGAISGLVKPYAIPAMLAVGRWRAVLVAGAVVVVTLPLLPWATFRASEEVIKSAFAEFTVVVSAFGDPGLMVATAIALASLGYRRGLGLFTPGLLAQQPHYLVFSLEFIAVSRWLTFAMTLPYEHAAANGIIAYALFDQLRFRIGRVRTMRAARRAAPAIPDGTVPAG